VIMVAKSSMNVIPRRAAITCLVLGHRWIIDTHVLLA
jgi:hypothetical protein